MLLSPYHIEVTVHDKILIRATSWRLMLYECCTSLPVTILVEQMTIKGIYATCDDDMIQ